MLDCHGYWIVDHTVCLSVCFCTPVYVRVMVMVAMEVDQCLHYLVSDLEQWKC